MKIVNVVGARPNFMKIAPLIEEMKKHTEIVPILVHTGQHYDQNMSKLFFEDLQLPRPDIYLRVGSGTHAEQTAKIMTKFERVIIEEKADLIIVVGDVNSTIACALTAAKMRVKIAHVEAGLRSFDRSMPEEINRVLTDTISDYLFITEESAMKNLLNEGVSKEKIHFVGNVMIDTLLKNKAKANKSNILEQLKLSLGNYALVTLHRPSNVDDANTFKNILEALNEISKYIKIVFPIHPRTQKSLKVLKTRYARRNTQYENIIFTEPLGYIKFLKLMSNAKFVLTDSGGIQEETTVLGVPCLTIRKNTERPVTVEQGTNTIIGTSKDAIIKECLKKLKKKTTGNKIPELWDGKAAKRVVSILLKVLRK